MAYIGKKAEETVLANRTVDTMTGDGSDTTLALSTTPISVNNVLITIDGVMQRPTNEYTLSGSTITFTTAPANGSVVYAITGGGEHIGTPLNELQGYQFADNAVTDDKIATGISASKLTGTKGAWDASALTGLGSGVTEGSADPTVSTTTTAGDIFLNNVSGELYVCTDATAGANVWTNVGLGTGNIALPSNPTNPTNTFPTSHTESSSYTFTFTGGTDVDGANVTHYLVDTISSDKLTVSSAEVAAGQAHTFNTLAVNADETGITFRVRAKDSAGRFSSGVTFTTSVTNLNHIQVTSNVTPTVSGDYHVYTFTSSAGNFFNVTAVPASGPNTGVRYLVVGGGGSGSSHDGAGGAGGGAGGMRFNNAYDHTVSVQNYSITVGAGANGGTTTVETGYKGSPSTFSTITSAGGGGGGRATHIGGTITSESNGGSGGGGGWHGAAAGLGNQPTTSPSQGNNGGLGQSGGGGAGGGGHSAVGGTATTATAAAGGAGTANDITGASLFYAGGGGGGCNSTSGVGGAGGSGVGGQGHIPSSNTPAGDGMNGRGGGGGANGWPVNFGGYTWFKPGDGGDGVVIIRVKFQN